jgi:RimJ/RimL family protein N-acetyltransferase
MLWIERVLETPSGRLRLEPMLPQHAPEMAEVLADPSLGEHVEGRPPSTEYLAHRYEILSSRSSPNGRELWLNWVIRLVSEARAIGFVQATVGERAASLAWVVGVAWQGAGIATEAATAVIEVLEQEQGVSTFTASIAPDNQASKAVATKLGMNRSGAVHDGEEVWVLTLSG